MLRRLFVGGNWKSNGTLAATKELVERVLNPTEINYTNVNVVVAPVALHLNYVRKMIRPEIKVAAQNISLTSFGAYTGEVAAEQVKDLGLEWTILGHSERRTLYGDTDQVVTGKVKRALQVGLNVIACCGENLTDRERGAAFDIIGAQLEAMRPAITDWAKVVIAYEPIWAIGTGKTASPLQAQEVHKFIRQWLAEKVNAQVSGATRIIYGGSVTDANAKELIGQTDVDGFLVGGAALKPAFRKILEACNVAGPKRA